jgi:hypothetical protein
MGVEKVARATLGCAMMVALGAASPAVVHADTPCKQWTFDGYTEFDFSDGGKFAFGFDGSDIPPDSADHVYEIPPNGGPASEDYVHGGVFGNNNLLMFTKRLILQGGVTDDGFAYGVSVSQTGGGSGSFRSAVPLKCADNGG